MEVGVFCSSNKPYLWGNLYETLSATSVNFNLCIAGPYPPIEPLPGNVKYIQTNVKPAQCYFIAEQNTIGECIMMMADDVSLTPYCLDDLVGMMDGKMTIASCKYSRTINLDQAHYWFVDKRVPKIEGKWKVITLDFPLPIGAMMYREIFDDIGIDKNYIAMNWNVDMYFNVVSNGGKIILSNKSVLSDLKISGLCKVGGDYNYLTEMWFNGDKFRHKRKNPVSPLVYNDTVLTVSQGRVHPSVLEKREYKVGTKSKIIPDWV